MSFFHYRHGIIQIHLNLTDSKFGESHILDFYGPKLDNSRIRNTFLHKGNGNKITDYKLLFLLLLKIY